MRRQRRNDLSRQRGCVLVHLAHGGVRTGRPIQLTSGVGLGEPGQGLVPGAVAAELRVTLPQRRPRAEPLGHLRPGGRCGSGTRCPPRLGGGPETACCACFSSSAATPRFVSTAHPSGAAYATWPHGRPGQPARLTRNALMGDRGQEAVAVRPQRGLGAVADAECAKDAGQVSLDGRLADAQLLADLLV